MQIHFIGGGGTTRLLAPGGGRIGLTDLTTNSVFTGGSNICYFVYSIIGF